MSTDCVLSQVDKEMVNSTGETPVLNISGWVKRVPRNKRKQKKTTETSPKSTIHNKFDYKNFPTILTGILLKHDATNLRFVPYNQQYLGILCLKNTKTNTRIYHTFNTAENNIGRDYDKMRLLYENNPDIRYKNNITVQTICSRSLRRSAQNSLKEFKWNKEGNIFETPCNSGTDEWVISNRLYDLSGKQNLQLLNYILFLKSTKS